MKHTGVTRHRFASWSGLKLKFDNPTDAIVSRFFRDHRSLGPREQATMAHTV